MANRRMFSSRITESTRFIKMPVSSQNLYFHLGMNADDDGVVEAYPVMCTIGATEDDLRVLVGKQFATVLNEDYVTFLNDWMENNNIRADRKVDSIYKDLLLQIVPDACLKDSKQKYYSRKKDVCLTSDGQLTDVCLTSDGQLTDVCLTSDGQLTDVCLTTDRQLTDVCLTTDRQVTDKCQHRLGKGSIGKDRLDKYSVGKGSVVEGSVVESQTNNNQAITNTEPNVNDNVNVYVNANSEPNNNHTHQQLTKEQMIIYNDLVSKYNKQFVDIRIERARKYPHWSMNNVKKWCDDDWNKEQQSPTTLYDSLIKRFCKQFVDEKIEYAKNHYANVSMMKISQWCENDWGKWREQYKINNGVYPEELEEEDMNYYGV